MKTELRIVDRGVDADARPRFRFRRTGIPAFQPTSEGIIPMRYSLLPAAVLGLAATLCSVSVFAQAKTDFGKREYEFNCAGCHGPTGGGDGPYVRYLTVKVPALTTLAKKNNGVFPVERVYQIIDGRQEVKAHGPRNMPVWGADYLVQAGAASPAGNMDVASDPEVFVRSRIKALVDYLNRLQVK
jgi:mono/diheme cytochrome c family protein